MRRPGLIFLILITVGLFLFILLWEQKQPSTDELRQQEKKVFNVDQKDVTRIDFKGGANAYTLAKEKGTWRITAPIEAPAEESAVSAILSDISSLEKVRELTDVDPKTYALDSPRATITLTIAGEPVEIAIGNAIPTSSNIAMKISGHEGVIIASNKLYMTADKPVVEMRRKKIFDFTTTDVASISVQGKDQTLLFEKRGSSWYIEKPVKDRVKGSAVNDLLFGITGLQTKTFYDTLDDATIKRLGLDHPAYHIILSSKDGKPLAQFDTGRSTQDRGTAFSVRFGERAYGCADNLWNHLQRKPGEYIDDKLLAFERWSLTHAEFKVGETTWSLLKDEEDGVWKRDGIKVEHQEKVNAILDAMNNWKVKSTIKSSRLGKKRADVTLTWREGKRTFTLYTVTGKSNIYAVRVNDRPGIYTLDAFEWEGVVNNLKSGFRKGGRSEAQKNPPDMAKHSDD